MAGALRERTQIDGTIDTHAGPGRHLSEGDPDGQVPGTPMFAAIAARAAQRRFSGVEIHVRTTDKNRKIASELDRRLRGLKGRPPDGVDVTVESLDWVTVVPRIRAEIEREDHPLGAAEALGDTIIAVCGSSTRLASRAAITQ